MNQLAIIDIGTNSVLLLLSVNREGKLIPVLERAEITRLGANFGKEQKLDATAMRRTLKAVKKFSQLARESGAEPLAFGTEILRIAANSANFLREAEGETGLQIQVLSGDQEAELTYMGAVDTLQGAADRVAVIDIGGGSTEIALGNGDRPDFVHSFPLGAVKLMEKFNLNDPPLPAEIDEMEQFIQNFWKNKPEFSPQARFIGVGGTLTTLATLSLRLPQYDFNAVDGLTLTRRQIEKQLDGFLSRTLEQRKAMVGMEPARADIIIPATLILKSFMGWIGFKEITVSARGVRFGFLKAILQERGMKPPSVMPA